MLNENMLRVMAKAGPWALLACLLIYVLVVDVRGDQKDSRALHGQIVIEQQNLARGVLKLADKTGETQMLQEKILMVTRQLCVQGATTIADRRACLKE